MQSSSDTLAAYIIGFNVIKLKFLINNNSSSSNSILLKGILFFKASSHFFKTSYSAKASFSFVVWAFFSIFTKRLLAISKTERINSTLMISISLIGSVLPST